MKSQHVSIRMPPCVASIHTSKNLVLCTWGEIGWVGGNFLSLLLFNLKYLEKSLRKFVTIFLIFSEYQPGKVTFCCVQEQILFKKYFTVMFPQAKQSIYPPIYLFIYISLNSLINRVSGICIQLQQINNCPQWHSIIIFAPFFTKLLLQSFKMSLTCKEFKKWSNVSAIFFWKGRVYIRKLSTIEKKLQWYDIG